MRSRRALTLALAFILVSTALGALAVQAMGGPRPGAPPLPTTESGALAHVAAADAQAAAWRADAVRVRVGATEGPQVEGRVDPPFLWDTSGDPAPGNGAALVWTFAYASPELPGRSFWVSVGGDGSTLYARELVDPYWCCMGYFPGSVAPAHPESASVEESSTSSPSYHPPALRPVSAEVDAPAAVASVLDRPEFRNFTLDHPVFLAHLELTPGGPENHSVWLVGYRTATLYGAGAVVDAVTGEVLHVGAWPHRDGCCAVTPVDPIVDPPLPPEPCCRPDDFHRAYEGHVRDGESFDVGFPIDSAAFLDAARVRVAIADPAPDATYVLHVVDGHGRRLAEATGTDALEVTLEDAPISATYSAHVWRQDGAVPATGLRLPVGVQETLVQVAIDVTYAAEPQPRPASFRFLGEAWPGAQSFDLRVEGEGWTPMRPTTLTFAYEPSRPGDAMEVAVLDRYGNEVASARGDPLSVDAQTLVLDVPQTGGPDEFCCHYVEIRHEGAYFPQSALPWTLDVEVAPWQPAAHDDLAHAHEGHGGH